VTDPPATPGPPTSRPFSAPRSAAGGRPTTLLVVRHARTPATEQARFCGRGGADPALSARGEAEAQRLGRLLAALGGPRSPLPDVARPALVVASPLRRTRQTAAIVGPALDLDPQAAVVVDGSWAEMSFGAWEHLTYAEVSARFPAELAAWQGSLTVAPPGGDAMVDVIARVLEARRRLVEQHPGRTVVVVSHVTCVRAVIREALDAGDAAMWRTRVTPAGLTAVRYWPDGGIELATVNATAHLAHR
jgi:probable phosphoglycerate mutase